MASPIVRNYLILPSTGIRLTDNRPDTTTEALFSKLSVDVQLGQLLDHEQPTGAVVVDTIGNTGIKLVQIADNELAQVRAQLPGVRLVPEVFYYRQWQRETILEPFRVQQGQPRVGVRIKLAEAKTGKPVAGVTVVAFTNFEQRQGEQATSNAQGIVAFKNIGGQRIDQLFGYPKTGYWSLWRKNLTLIPDQVIELQPLKLDYIDSKQFFYPSSKTDLTAGNGVKVGVIDTGAGPHPDLQISGGACTVTGESPTDYGDVDEHGTHVSGIVAARGTSPTGVRGAAPGVELRAYRVFGKNANGASNFAIIKAIEQAVADGCDLINMSLGGGPADDATKDAITFARDHGTICFVATGNDDRSPVSFPAAFSLSLAVGALGRKGTFPANTTDAPYAVAPYGTDKKNFVAGFSNIGPEVDFIAPGVGIISTVPGGYAPLSGTSMACPLATGVAARLLATQPSILAMPRTAARAEAMIAFLHTKVKSMGFGPIFEGTGQFFL
ncbi:S8 family peptidase [Fibrivirga algicola]|uniref:S8 family serine peptidase n=1 Tax=Fibrivirga algicola TaxID=2950420 RepID=A0ABX0QG20_9BACT|nr:S8 family serine peptidase [Fibrivirga algicola]NID10992.1 S8 family serine peptidase [Fibrivirga algicola]